MFRKRQEKCECPEISSLPRGKHLHRRTACQAGRCAKEESAYVRERSWRVFSLQGDAVTEMHGDALAAANTGSVTRTGRSAESPRHNPHRAAAK
ncbi:hypothetical protein FQA47_018457 [Oryzias melastigma]|uniref:Uncharacterized protein n=1 Tax=Oryzias melastigma TaxID=30732 RepID=A0A834C3F7_ORYME|nr:hypothetical protein FQA47_018457 [Oryzias melastigma]